MARHCTIGVGFRGEVIVRGRCLVNVISLVSSLSVLVDEFFGISSFRVRCLLFVVRVRISLCFPFNYPRSERSGSFGLLRAIPPLVHACGNALDLELQTRCRQYIASTVNHTNEAVRICIYLAKVA